MVRRVLRPRGGSPRAAQRGFTFVETMVAMAVATVVLTANFYLFNVSRQKLALARTLTEATNLATNRIADFRAMTIAEINAAAPTLQAGANPLGVRRGSDVTTVDGIAYTRTWVVSSIDLEHANPPVADMVGDLVKITLEVSWALKGKPHTVTMTTFAAGRAT